MATGSGQHGRLVLYIDTTRASQYVQQALERSSVAFDVVYGTSAPFYPLPAIRGPYGVVYGYNDIRRNLLPELQDIEHY